MAMLLRPAGRAEGYDYQIKSVRHFRHTLACTPAWLLSFCCLQSELGTTQAPQAENTWCMRQLVYVENCI